MKAAGPPLYFMKSLLFKRPKITLRDYNQFFNENVKRFDILLQK